MLVCISWIIFRTIRLLLCGNKLVQIVQPLMLHTPISQNSHFFVKRTASVEKRCQKLQPIKLKPLTLGALKINTLKKNITLQIQIFLAPKVVSTFLLNSLIWTSFTKVTFTPLLECGYAMNY